MDFKNKEVFSYNSRTAKIILLYSRNTNISRNIIKHNIRTSMNERTYFFIKIYLSHFILKRVMFVVCERWVGDRDGRLYWNKFFRDHSSSSFASWLGCSTVGQWGPKALSLQTGSRASILSPTDPNRLDTWLYYCLASTCFRCSSAYLHRCISWLTARSRVNI